VVLMEIRKLIGLRKWLVAICSMEIGLGMTHTLSTLRDHVLTLMSRLTAISTVGEN
jgi:hypothetical protein